MPQLIPLAIYAIGTVLEVSAIYVTAATLVATLAISEYQKRKADRAQKAQYDASQVDRLANVPATMAPRELVLGRVRKGGNVFFRGSAGQFKQLFSMCITLAGHEIDGVEQVYFNNIPVSIDGSGNVTTFPYGRNSLVSVTENVFGVTTTLSRTPVAGSIQVVQTSAPSSSNEFQVTSPDFTISGTTLTVPGYTADGSTYQVTYQYVNFTTTATVRWYLGAPGQQSDPRLQGLYPGVWGPNHRVDGIAYLIADFLYDETAMPNGLPNVTALVRGAKCYDPRTGLTIFTECPALMMRHVMMHPQFGKRAAMTATEDARIIAAANACEAAISYTGSDSVSMYRASIVMPYGATARDALDDLAQAMAGQWAYAEGELFVRAGVYQAPVMNLFDADLAVVARDNSGSTSQNQITISVHKARADQINSISARIWDQAASYVETPIYPFTPAAYVAADGAVLSQEVTMPAVFYAPQAWAICGIMLRDNRDPLVVTATFKMTAYQLEIFDGVTLTLSRYGWTAKEFQVLGRTFNPDGTVTLTLKETSSSIYAYGAPFVPGGYAANTTLPNPWVISPPTIRSVTSGADDLVVQSDGTVIDAVRVTWDTVQDQSVLNGGSVEVVYLLPGANAWRSISVPGSQTYAVITDGIYDGAVIGIRLRAHNSLAASDYGLQVWHTVIGKSEPPPDIQNLTIAGSVLSWVLPGRVPDLAGFIFRFQYGNNLDWGSATPLHTGVITQSPYNLVTRPSGVVTIMGKAIDTSGNQSLATANIVMNLGDQRIANIVVNWDFLALGWPNSAIDSSGWTLVGGNPTANALDSFYGTDTQSFYGTDTDSFYASSAYGQMVYVTSEVAVQSALAGSLMTLATTAQGVDLRIEYRLSGPGSFYGTDGASFYGADTDPLYGAPGAWQPWPGQMVAANDVYQFRVTIGAGTTQGILQTMVLTIDAPDIVETIANLPVSSAGTLIPHSKPFSVIKVVNATLQANGSGAVTVEIDKTVALAPTIKAYNSAHTAVSGATVDILLQGY